MEARTTMTPRGLAVHLGRVLAGGGKITNDAEKQAVQFARDVLAERDDHELASILSGGLVDGLVRSIVPEDPADDLLDRMQDAEGELRDALAGAMQLADDRHEVIQSKNEQIKRLRGDTQALLARLGERTAERDRLAEEVSTLRTQREHLQARLFGGAPLAGPGQPMDVPVSAAHPDTSRAAAESVRITAANIRCTVLADLIEHGPANAGTVAQRTGICSANHMATRFDELRKLKWITQARWPNGEVLTAKTPSGRAGIVHELTSDAVMELRRQHGSLALAAHALRKMGRGDKLGSVG